MYIFLKGKKKLNWAIPSWIGLFAGIFFLIISPQKDISSIFLHFTICFIGAFTFSAHIYGIINMFLNDDFSKNSYYQNRAIVQVLYLLALIPITYWHTTQIVKPLNETVINVVYYIFSIYTVFIVAGILVLIIAGFIAFVIDFFVYHASEFPDVLEPKVKYDSVSICYASIPVAIVLVFIIYFFASQSYISYSGYLPLWLLMPLIVLFAVDLNCFLIRSLPREQVTNLSSSLSPRKKQIDTDI
jgi:hypothetical protein